MIFERSSVVEGSSSGFAMRWPSMRAAAREVARTG